MAGRQKHSKRVPEKPVRHGAIPQYHQECVQGQYLLYRIPQPAPIAQSDHPLTQRSVDAFWNALCEGKSSQEDLVDFFEFALPMDVRREVLVEPRLGMAVLGRFDYRLRDPEAAEMIGAVMSAWIKKANLKDKEALKAKGEAKRGRRLDPDVRQRREILKDCIKVPRELRDPDKLRNLFGRLERHRVPIPNSQSRSTAWMELLNDTLQKELLKSALAVLRKDLDRA
jgi:hypothetical protein